MSLTVTQNGDNAFIPGVWAQSYVPDQLIADTKLVVTQNIVLGGGAALPRGSMLGQQSLGTATYAATGGNTGNGTVTAIALGAKAKPGTYNIRWTGATTYEVTDPTGDDLKTGIAAGAYTDAQIGFTFTAGGVAMVAGDSGTITVGAGSGNYVLSTTSATDGSQVPSALLVDSTDASGGNVAAGAYVSGEFNGNALNLGTGWTIASATAALQSVGIFIKPVVSAADPSGE